MTISQMVVGTVCLIVLLAGGTFATLLVINTWNKDSYSVFQKEQAAQQSQFLTQMHQRTFFLEQRLRLRQQFAQTGGLP